MKFHALKQANYHHKILSMNRNPWSYLFSTLYNKREALSVSSKFSPSEQILPMCLVQCCWISCQTLSTWLSTIMRSYYSYKVFSLHDNSTHVTWRFETSFLKFTTTGQRQVLKIGFCTVEAYLLLHAQTKFYRHILKNQQFIQHYMQTCNQSVQQCCYDLHLCNTNIFLYKSQELVVNHFSEYI